VRSQVGPVGERPRTPRAGERPLAGVSPHVTLQQPRSRERLPAHRAPARRQFFSPKLSDLSLNARSFSSTFNSSCYYKDRKVVGNRGERRAARGWLSALSSSQQQTLSGRAARVYTCTCVHDNMPCRRLPKWADRRVPTMPGWPRVGKNLLNSNVSPTCRYSMVNFGPLGAEIVSLIWGIPANVNGFRVFAALLHDTLVVGVSQTAALNRGRHLYSAGRPSPWALAQISSICLVSFSGSLR